MRHRLGAALLGAALALSGTAHDALAEGAGDSCHFAAKRESGYRGGRPVIGKVGNVTVRLSGSASVGVTHRSKPGLTQKSPPFAGSAARERREKKAFDAYMRAYERCMIGG